jgi:hypothetical protein
LAALSLRCERVAAQAARIPARQLYRVTPGWFGVRVLCGQRCRRKVVMSGYDQPASQPARQRAAAESLGVLPLFMEERPDIADGRPTDGELYACQCGRGP